MAERCPRCQARGFESGDVPCRSCGWADPVLPPWVPAAWYYDPAAEGRERYWAYGRWVGKSRELRIGTAIPTQPPPPAVPQTEPQPAPWTSVAVTTSHEFPGARIVRHQGEVFGITVRTRNTIANAIAGVRGIVGGEVGSYTKLMVMARREALDRLRREADAIDANAVVSMRLTANQISEDMTEIVAYGAAVVIEQSAVPAEDDADSR